VTDRAERLTRGHARRPRLLAFSELRAGLAPPTAYEATVCRHILIVNKLLSLSLFLSLSLSLSPHTQYNLGDNIKTA
jgi:hypothetical protein